MKTARWCLASLLLACSGTETGNPPVIDFGNTGCHDQSYRLSKGDVEPVGPDPRYRGLTCLVWDHPDEQTLRIQLTNYDVGCGAGEGWQPRVERRADGSLDLVLQDEECATANCDADCTHDVSFSVPLSESLPDSVVRVYQRGCPDYARELREATLALASQPSGAVCDYASYHDISISGRLGRERDLCGEPQGLPSTACGAGLSCSDLGTLAGPPHNVGSRCLRACSSDADCDALSACDGALCQLRGPALRYDAEPVPQRR